MEELEKAKLLAVAQKIAKSEVAEVRNELLEQINKIQSITPASGIPGRGIIDVALIEEELVLQFNDGSFANLGHIIGEQGIQGIRGEQGLQGEQGITGEQGIQGEQGIPGIQGEQGDKGDRGDQGPRGEKGEKGDTGDRGKQGIPGERGERGEQGPAGIDGTPGRDGTKGEAGETGPQGVPGGDGKNGKNGKDGKDGATGLTGDKGDKGDPGSDANTKEIEKKFDKLVENVDKRFSRFTYSAATGVKHSGSGEVWLHRLDDVDYNSVKTPTNGQALVWNVAIGKWTAGAVVSSGGGGGNGGISNSFTTTVSTRNIIPSSNNTYSIGSSTNRYKDIWVSGNTIYLGSATIEAVGNQLSISGQAVLSASASDDKFATKAYAASNTYVKAILANTNSYIASRASWNALTTTNTVLRLYVDTKVATVVNSAPETLNTLQELSTALGNNANFSTTVLTLIGTKASNTYVKAILANTNLYINTKASWDSLTSTNTALRTLINDRLQVSNANAKFATKAYAAANSYVKTTLANTNAYIATKPGWSAITATNTAIRTLVSDRIQVANANAKFATKAYAAANSYVKTLLANTNAYIATKPQFYYSTTMYDYTQYGLGYSNAAPNQDPVTLGFRTDVPAPPFGSIWILAVNDGLVDPAPITIYSPNTRTTPMLWMSIDGTGPYTDSNPNGQAYWFNITPPPQGA
jgi:hypothetical protein